MGQANRYFFSYSKSSGNPKEQPYWPPKKSKPDNTQLKGESNGNKKESSEKESCQEKNREA